jgi:hypothetical protein
LKFNEKATLRKRVAFCLSQLMRLPEVGFADYCFAKNKTLFAGGALARDP